MEKSLEQLYTELTVNVMKLYTLFEEIKENATEEQKKEVEKLQEQIASVDKVVK